jgi:hypothetical protein
MYVFDSGRDATGVLREADEVQSGKVKKIFIIEEDAGAAGYDSAIAAKDNHSKQESLSRAQGTYVSGQWGPEDAQKRRTHQG